MRIILGELYEKVFRVRDDVRFIGCVHDELNLAIRKEVLFEVLPTIRAIMSVQVPQCKLPLQTGVELGYSYGFMFEFEENAETRLAPVFLDAA